MMRYFRSLSLVLFIGILANSCKEKDHSVNFYYWKTNVSIYEVEKQYFNDLNCEKLYVRLFDIDSDGSTPYPQAKIKMFDGDVLDAQYVPVVFITNRTFQNLNSSDVKDLAQRTLQLIKDIQAKNNLKESGEIQIDCDWTESTRIMYFQFLDYLHTISNLDISCTIRLHQIKYKKTTGVPPVSKGYLMCYATSNPNEANTQNSILDMQLLKDYTGNINDYPLPFDIALPLYSWGVVTNHLGRIKIINGIDEKDMDPSLFKHVKDNIYEVQEDTFFQGLYLNAGFTIRIESITPELLQEAKTYLNSKVKTDYTIVYYHLDNLFLKRFTVDDLK